MACAAPRTGLGVASHQFDAFILDPGKSRYRGRFCRLNRCPKGKRECLVLGCGAAKFLQQHEDFQWRPDSLAEDRIVRLFEPLQRPACPRRRPPPPGG